MSRNWTNKPECASQTQTTLFDAGEESPRRDDTSDGRTSDGRTSDGRTSNGHPAGESRSGRRRFPDSNSSGKRRVVVSRAARSGATISRWVPRRVSQLATSPVQTCRHLEVDWLDSHTCACRQCGKFGHWFEDGFVLWRRDRPRAKALQASRGDNGYYHPVAKTG